MKRYTIGQISSILDIPTKTIRYYADIGLCVPSEVDPDTGYRYYSLDNVFLIDLVRCLGHRTGMPLKKIKEYIEKIDDPAILHAYLLEQEAQIDAQIEELLRRREFLSEKINAVVRKKISRKMVPELAEFPPRTVYVTPVVSETQEESMLAVRHLAAGCDDVDERTLYMLTKGIEFYHGNQRWMDCEVGLDVPATAELRETVLPEGTYAVIRYQNTTEDYQNALRILMEMIQSSGLKPVGPLIFKSEVIDTTSSRISEMDIEMQTLLQ